MRPILKPPLPDAYFAVPPSALLLQTFGEYCSVSEQPLPSNHHVWHKRLGIEHTRPVSRTHWGDLLLLCENSFLAQMGRPVPTTLLYPDEHPLTFSFARRKLFNYSLDRVETVFVDERGAPVGSATRSEEVIVSGSNQAANETIEFFALNSQFFNPDSSAFTIPVHAHRIGFDRRVRQRTKVWHMAVAFAGRLLREAPDFPDAHGSLIEQGRALAAATGYWSTWASALLHEGVLPEAVSELLLPMTPPPPWEVGPGFHNPYPGTNPAVVP